MAVERAGGTRAVYRNPRYASSLQQTTDFEVDGVGVELRHGEISSPAIVSGPRAFGSSRVHDDDIELLMRPRKTAPPPARIIHLGPRTSDLGPSTRGGYPDSR
jgi:hypothetical protein